MFIYRLNFESLDLLQTALYAPEEPSTTQTSPRKKHELVIPEEFASASGLQCLCLGTGVSKHYSYSSCTLPPAFQGEYLYLCTLCSIRLRQASSSQQKVPTN